MKYIAVVDIPDVLLEEHEEGTVWDGDITVDCNIRASEDDARVVVYRVENIPMRPLPNYKEYRCLNEILCGLNKGADWKQDGGTIIVETNKAESEDKE